MQIIQLPAHPAGPASHALDDVSAPDWPRIFPAATQLPSCHISSDFKGGVFAVAGDQPLK